MRKTVCRAMVLIAVAGQLTACSSWKWWGAKQVARQTAEDMAEGANLTKTKEELREEIRELKAKIRDEREEKVRLEIKVRELEARCAASTLLPGAK